MMNAQLGRSICSSPDGVCLLTRVWLLINRFAIVSTWSRLVSALSFGTIGRFDVAATYGVEDGQLGDTSGACRPLSVSTCSSLKPRRRANQSVPEPRSLARFDSFSAPATIAGGDMMTMRIAVSHGRPGG